MKTIQLNQEQQQVLQLLKQRCEKVELFANQKHLEDLLPDTFLCLLEDQKIIEVTFSSEEDCVDVMFWNTEEYAECEEYISNEELDNSFIDRMFETVANDSLKRLDYCANKAYVARIQEFLNKA
jgi:hypothetical protein